MTAKYIYDPNYSARIVSVSVPRIKEAPQVKTAEDLVVYIARVSNPGNQGNMETGAKLIDYLIRKKHWSPFTMVNVVVEAELTRDIGRQLLRHWSIAPQEFSQRYADARDLGFAKPFEARLQDPKSRQNSLITDDQEIQKMWRMIQDHTIKQADIDYTWAINHGIAKELARKILPEGLTMSRMYLNGNLRSWIHYLQQRRHWTTQKEHRDLAENVAAVLSIEFPLFAKAFEPQE